MNIISDFYRYFLFIILLYLVVSCNIINPEEDIPAYIKIDKFTNKLSDTNSIDVSDAWVYIDDNIVGAYELPAKFPLLKEGYHKLTIRPGIKLNGIASTRAIYPFYDSSIAYLNLISKDIYSLNSKIRYKQNVLFEMNEDFELPTRLLIKTSRSDTNIKVCSNDIYNFDYGKKNIGKISLTEDKPYFEVETNRTFKVPASNKTTFLELNYLTGNIFKISVKFISNNTTIDYLTINKSGVWKKMYVNITPNIDTYSAGTEYKLLFSSRLETGLSQADILLDNIKLIRFNE